MWITMYMYVVFHPMCRVAEKKEMRQLFFIDMCMIEGMVYVCLAQHENSYGFALRQGLLSFYYQIN